MNLVGLRSQISSGWPTAPDSIFCSKSSDLYERGRQFRTSHPASVKKMKLGQLAICWNPEPAKSASPTRFLSKIDQ